MLLAVIKSTLSGHCYFFVVFTRAAVEPGMLGKNSSFKPLDHPRFPIISFLKFAVGGNKKRYNKDRDIVIWMGSNMMKLTFERLWHFNHIYCSKIPSHYLTFAVTIFCGSFLIDRRECSGSIEGFNQTLFVFFLLNVTLFLLVHN